MDKRLQKQITKRKIANMGYSILGISFVIMVITAFIEMSIIFIMSVVFCFTGLFIAMIFQNTSSHIFKPFKEKLKLIGNYKDRRYEIQDATIYVEGYAGSSSIIVGIPNIKGATIRYDIKLGHEMSEAMEIALEERKISPYEFYIKYIETDLLNCMTKTYNELNSEKIKLGHSVFEFMDKKDGIIK